MKTSTGARQSDHRATTGAVYVEFLIAFMPLFVFFMSLVQLAYVEAANIVVKHAAVMATRAPPLRSVFWVFLAAGWGWRCAVVDGARNF